MAAFTVIMQLDAPTKAAITSIEQSLVTIASATSSDESLLAGIEAALASIVEAIETPPPPPLVALVIGTPIAIKGKIVMANFAHENDAILAWPIVAENAGGVLEPVPDGDTFTVVPSNPAAFNAVIGTATFPPATDAAPAVLTNALVALSDSTNGGGGLFFTVTDSTGLKSGVSPLFDIVVDAVPVALGVGATPIVVGSQAAPPAAGP